MLCCSLQHWTLLSPTDSSTTQCHFYFGPVTSFFLELLVIPLSSSPVAYWILSNLEGIFHCHTFLHFHTVHGVLMARILEWFVISSSSGPHFVRTLHDDVFSLGGPAWHGLQLHELHKPIHQNMAVIHEVGKNMKGQLFTLSQAVDFFLLFLLLLFSFPE